MSIEYLMIKTKCIIWRNIQLPHPNNSLKSPAFCLEGQNMHIKVTCSWENREKQEVWNFSIEHPNNGFYDIIPYVEKSRGMYARINVKTYRTSFTKIRGIDGDIVTLLFVFEPLNEISTKASKEDASDNESIHSLCLEGLSKDIGRLFNENEYSDATLKCGDKSFAVHRSILVSRSEVFSAMFQHNMCEKNSGVVKIEDLDADILEQFLRYLYCGCVEEMSMDTVFELYKAADKYAVIMLKKLCASYILDNISENIVCKVLLLADEAGDVEFLNSIATFAARAEKFLRSAEWKEFAEKFPSIAIKVYFKRHN